LTVFIEEGVREGSFGEYAAAMTGKNKAMVLAVESAFLDEDRALGTREELLAANGLDGIHIAEKVISRRKSLQN
jgi:deoxyxylulose-5-phosphate synthase